MKKLGYLLLMLLAFTMVGCEKEGGEGDKQITLPNKDEKVQQAYADESGTGGFTFTAKSAWTASVSETAATASASAQYTAVKATRASGVSWLRLLLNGQEAYSGGAGTTTLAIELSDNLTGKARSASITIQSGTDKITVSVTQAGTTQEGEQPVPKIAKIVYTSNDGDAMESTFTYNQNDRIEQVLQSGYDGVGSLFTSDYMYSAGNIDIDITFKDGSGETGYSKQGMTLNSEGYPTGVTKTFKFGDESPFDGGATTLVYTNGFLSKVEDSNIIFWEKDSGSGGESGSYFEKANSTCTWDANGNMTKADFIVEEVEDLEEGYWFNQTAQYGSNLNNANIDINTHVLGVLNIPGVSGFMFAKFGKTSKNLVSKVEITSKNDSPETVTYQYTASNGLLTKAIATSSTGRVRAYVFTYK